GQGKHVEIFDGLQSMFIDRETMRKIAYSQGVDAAQLRKQQREEMKGMHGPQCVGGVRFRKHFLKEPPNFRSVGDLRRKLSHAPRQLVFSGRTEFESVLRD